MRPHPFQVSLLGFEIAYQRPERRFAYLDLHCAQLMLEQLDADDHWLTGPLEKPFGRGINLQIDVAAVAPLLERLERHRWPLFQACEEVWYRADAAKWGCASSWSRTRMATCCGWRRNWASARLRYPRVSPC
ncbi:hypothetical protein OH705_02120 [Pseudomonas sp. BJa3]|nr:hypothetical protein [Pseudomonas sp. BJa3]